MKQEPAFVPLPGSERTPLLTARTAGLLDDTERIEVTLVTRSIAGLARNQAGVPARISRQELHQRHGSDPAEQALVADVLSGLGLEVTSRDAGSRRMTVAGPVSALAEVFGASLTQVTSTPRAGAAPVTHRYRTGGLRIPAQLDGIVVGVFGLDDRPQARAQIRFAEATGGQASSFTPPQVAGLYQFPEGTDGTGQVLAIIELGGGFSAGDLDAYFSGLGMATPSVTAASVDGGQNVPGQDPQGADGEVLLDIEVAGSVAPGAVQIVYFAPNTDRGFIDAVTTAVHGSPTPTAVSISWGQSEDSWTAQARSALDAAIADGAAIGVTVCAAAGDNGSSDGASDGSAHADFPASSPHALGCGGTSLQADPAAGLISAEAVWNDGPGGGAGGGGISDVFALPSWQAGVGVPAGQGGAGRGVPDVAGNADPQTGYQVLVDGQPAVVGGTSAVAPLWAALICRMAQATGKSFGMIQESLYAGVQVDQAAAGFRDITQGSNGAYSAAPGWDACTGLGSPAGPALLARLSATGSGSSTAGTGVPGAPAGSGG